MTTEDAKFRTRLAEIMSSGGLGYNQISQEILYLLPQEFVNSYVSLWEIALGSTGSGDRAGQQRERDAELGKSRTRTEHKGRKIGAGSGGAGKRFRRMGMVVKNENALALKDRIDRRLRAIARDIRAFEDAGGRGETIRRPRTRCTACGQLMDDGWKFCPNDGSVIHLDSSRGR